MKKIKKSLQSAHLRLSKSFTKKQNLQKSYDDAMLGGIEETNLSQHITSEISSHAQDCEEGMNLEGVEDTPIKCSSNGIPHMNLLQRIDLNGVMQIKASDVSL